MRGLVKNRVLGTLVLISVGAVFGLAFLRLAPNRLVLGTAIALPDLLQGWRIALLLPMILICCAIIAPQTRGTHIAVAVLASLSLFSLSWLAGEAAALLSENAPSSSRVSLGGSFWLLLATCCLAGVDALQRLELRSAPMILAAAALIAPMIGLVALGELNQLSLFKEYFNRADVFHAALLRHVQIVLGTLAPTLLIGIPLGWILFRHERLAPSAFGILNLIQTLPSLALFGLLIAPLAWLAATLPWLAALGVRGIGAAPAIVALTLYALLPIVRSTATGLAQVPRPVIEAAIGMGLTPRQIFWKVELPLALPVLLFGIRVTTVQAIGLTVVAALIGAGGLGSIMFQGLASSAIDLVLLGVLPVIALAVMADTLFRFVTLLLDRSHR